MRTFIYRIVHLLLIVMIVLLSGCGMFRKVFRSKEYSKLETKTEIRKDSVGLIIDKSITTVKEKIDTTVIIPEKIVKQDTYLNMDSLVNGMTAIQNDIMDLRLVLNPVTGILSAVATIKASEVPIQLIRETVKQNDITQQSSMSEEKQISHKQQSGSSIVKKEPVNIWFYILGLGLVVFILWCFKFWWKKKMPI